MYKLLSYSTRERDFPDVYMTPKGLQYSRVSVYIPGKSQPAVSKLMYCILVLPHILNGSNMEKGCMHLITMLTVETTAYSYQPGVCCMEILRGRKSTWARNTQQCNLFATANSTITTNHPCEDKSVYITGSTVRTEQGTKESHQCTSLHSPWNNSMESE